jgi:hypothetical protein
MYLDWLKRRLQSHILVTVVDGESLVIAQVRVSIAILVRDVGSILSFLQIVSQALENMSVRDGLWPIGST